MENVNLDVRCFWILAILSSLTLPGYGQEGSRSLQLDLCLRGGFLWPHRPVMNHLPETHIKGFELALSTKLNGTGTFKPHAYKAWHHEYNNPTVGVSFLFTQAGNQALMGNGLGLIGFARFPMIDREKFRLEWKLGTGPGFMTKIFHRTDNHKNIAIGTHLNLLAQLAMHAQIRFDRLAMRLGLSLTHFSNTAWKTPNLGINLPGLDLGFRYDIKSFETTQLPKEIELAQNKHSRVNDIKIMLAGGIREINPPQKRKYGSYSILTQYRLHFAKKSAFLIGADLMYNTSRLGLLADHAELERPIQILQPGLTVGYGQVFNRFMIFLQKGLYVYNPLPTDGSFYHRIGGNYIITEHWTWQFTVKVHYGKADHMEFAFGYRIGTSESKEKPEEFDEL